jgi:NAD-dependent SIR2 family protein deacetylase
VVIVNREPTPLDGMAAHVLRGAVEEILPALAAA